ncbi:MULTISPECIES: type II secretion system protein GspM [unclassified Acidovorax]|uniref:type II secretion system protein GspM n=1 Tax=unclassified Acidovorax TaxID=2684926 RepID=UPI0028834FB6|nr:MULTISPECIES: type II secretion system protein GspM [unclassified Acidovorax]
MKKLHVRELALVVGTLLVVLNPLVVGGWYVASKHRWAQGQLATLEPRHARLLGLEVQREEIASVLSKANQMRAQYIYPATQDPNQTGNVAQQKVRDIFNAAGLQIRSSQVLPSKDEKGFDRIPLTLRTEGDLIAVQSALAVLSSQLPIIILDDLEIQVVGGLASANPKFTPKLTVQFGLSVLRERP